MKLLPTFYRKKEKILKKVPARFESFSRITTFVSRPFKTAHPYRRCVLAIFTYQTWRFPVILRSNECYKMTWKPFFCFYPCADFLAGKQFSRALQLPLGIHHSDSNPFFPLSHAVKWTNKGSYPLANCPLSKIILKPYCGVPVKKFSKNSFSFLFILPLHPNL